MPPTEVSRKLKIPKGHSYRVFNAPTGYAGSTADESDNQVDVVYLFAHNRAELQQEFPAALQALKPGGAFWVSYPADGEDLSRNHGWGVLQGASLTAAEDTSLDDTWEAMRFAPTSETPSGAIPAADMLPVGRRAGAAFRVIRAVASPIFHLVFRFDVQGRERIPNTAYVLIANHLGWMDAISLLILFPPEPRLHYLADPTSMMRNRPLWALVRATGGIVPVDRAQHGNPLLFHQVDRCLKAGGVVALFPEGDFGPREGELLPFKKGFAHFAIDAGVAVLPVGLAGMKEVWLGKRLYVRVGEPIAAEGRTVDELVALGERGVAAALPEYHEPHGRKPLRRWLTGLF